MKHPARSQWPTIAFIAAALLGIGFAITAMLTEGAMVTKANWLMFVMLVTLIALMKSGKVHLPWWRRDDTPPH